MIPEDLHALEKAELIALVLKLSEQLQVLQARIEALEAPAKTARNSSLPPSKGHKSNLVSGKKKVRGKRKGISVIARPLMGIGITELPARHFLMASSAFIPWILAVAVTEQMSA